MMIRFILILTIIFVNFGLIQSQTKSDFDINNFDKLSDSIYNKSYASLADKIITSIEYKYWEFIYNHDYEARGKAITYKGDSSRYAKIIEDYRSHGGFLYDLKPDVCFYYIIAIKDDGKVDFINDKEKFKTFVGKIDNIEEAILITEINDYSFNNENKLIGSYKENYDSFYLYLKEKVNCNIFSVRALLKKTGEFKIFDKKIYKKNKRCIQI